MAEAQNSNGIGGQVSASVMQSVLDKFLTFSEQNSQASSGMVNAIEAMASNVAEMTGHLNALEQQIQEEQVSATLEDSVTKIKECIGGIKKSMESCSINQLTFLVKMCDHLTYQGRDPKVIADAMVKMLNEEGERQDDLKWALSIVGWVRNHILIISFLAGGLAIWLYLKAGVDTIGYIKTWLKY
jgi:hypothetical protein